MTRLLPTEAIPEFAVDVIGGPQDGERLLLHNLRPVFMGGQLAGYLADDEPTPTEAGAYVVTAELRLEWEPREEDESDDEG